MLHDVAADEGASAAKAGLAVDCDGPFGPLTDVHKLSQNLLAGGGAVVEVEVVVLKARVLKFPPGQARGRERGGA